ncbi:DivIVA domain-containing protein [Williamsia sp.]|uniref:DivIVA domain-containing protein n=1 Tax=Williamsia sp. TaxID=1872085 RepID=UPI002F95CF68
MHTTDSSSHHLITASEVRKAAFGKPPLGRRGYNEDDVDNFLDQVEETLRELHNRLSRYEHPNP